MTSANIHGSCVLCAGAGAIFGVAPDAGVLLVGESGSGKSDLALRLMIMGAQLVADDRCEIFFDSVLYARAPRNIAGLMEIRGVGIVSLPFAPVARIALVARATKARSVERLPAHRRYLPPPSITVPEHRSPPEIAVDALAASAPAKVLAAVVAFENHLFREEVPG